MKRGKRQTAPDDLFSVFILYIKGCFSDKQVPEYCQSHSSKNIYYCSGTSKK